uniref:Uncharacterized protein n=1 Tax=Anguilla anguilla TaxID=7936 RepID=A0A0E9QBK3_ANGAN
MKLIKIIHHEHITVETHIGPHSRNVCTMTFDCKRCVRTFPRTFRHSSFFLISIGFLMLIT